MRPFFTDDYVYISDPSMLHHRPSWFYWPSLFVCITGLDSSPNKKDSLHILEVCCCQPWCHLQWPHAVNPCLPPDERRKFLLVSLWKAFSSPICPNISLMKKSLVKKALPWLTQELSSLAQKLNWLYRKAKSSNLNSAWLSFCNPATRLWVPMKSLILCPFSQIILVCLLLPPT